MYKAGDFTNGKMNEIFKSCIMGDELVFSCIVIKHKQFGDFGLVSDRSMAIKSARLYCTITGVDLEDFYSGCDMDVKGGDATQMKKVHELIFPFDCDTEINWFDAFFMLTDRLGAILDNLDCNPCEGYLKSTEFEHKTIGTGV